MGYINKDELSNELLEYMEGLGLTEEQVNQIINTLREEELGNVGNLQTEAKDLVGAINELFQNVDNGKNLIATSIGNPLITGNSTFNAMSEAILGLRRESENETDAREVLYNMMIEDGYNQATNSMTTDELIDLLDASQIKVDEIKQVDCGAYHVIILKNDGTVWSAGGNDEGQLGLGDTNDRTTFAQVNINNVKQVSCGWDHTAVLKNDGTVWTCGNNEYGQLGTTELGRELTQISISNVKQIACDNSYSTFVLKNDGSVWVCGMQNNNSTSFKQITTNINNDVQQIACGYTHFFILKNDGSIWGYGSNNSGEIGIGVSNNVPVSSFTKVTTNVNNDVNYIACGYSNTFIIKNDGSVWGCGKLLNKNTLTRVFLGSTTEITEYEMDRRKLYIYLLDNEIPVTEDMDIGTMLSLLVEGYINAMINQYINNLRIVLADEGVETTDEDDMDSLISKVDQEFNKQVLPAGNATVNDVVNGKTFMNSNGTLLTGKATLGGKYINTTSTTYEFEGEYGAYVTIPHNLGVTPSLVVAVVSYLGIKSTSTSSFTDDDCYSNMNLSVNNLANTNKYTGVVCRHYDMSYGSSSNNYDGYMYITNVSSTDFRFHVYHNGYYSPSSGDEVNPQFKLTIKAVYCYI